MCSSDLNVYFQPPPSIQMSYPCIVYSLSDLDVDAANDTTYRITKRYQVSLIDRNPDTPHLMKIASLSRCRFERHYTADNLNHDVFNLYY